MARVGGARIFFDVVGQFQAQRLINDAQANMTVLAGIFMDAADAIFQGFTGLFDSIGAGVEEVVTTFMEFEEQLVRVRKFYGGLTEETDAFVVASVELGKAFGFSGDQALKSSAKMAQLKAVLGESQAVIAGTEMGLLFAAIGEMETEQAMNRLINLAQQTGFIYGELGKEVYDLMDAEMKANVLRQNTIRILDQLNSVENSSVATMEQITFTLNQYASQANLAGESIGEMAAMSALLIESGEEATRAGTGMRMMYQRLANEGTHASDAIAEYLDGIEAQEVRTMSLTEVLGHLSGVWNELSQEQQQNLAISVGGGRHYVKFLKLIENHTRLVQLQGAAYRGVYSAIDEFNIRQQSSFFQLQILEAEIYDVKRAIGEELAPAYVDAQEAQLKFWGYVEKVIEKESGKRLAENVIQMSAVFEQAKPVVDFTLGLLSMIIAMSTLHVIIRATRGEVDYLSQSYARTALQESAASAIKMQSVKIRGANIMAIKAETDAIGLFAQRAYEGSTRVQMGLMAEYKAREMAIEVIIAKGEAESWGRASTLNHLAAQASLNWELKKTILVNADLRVILQERWFAEKAVAAEMAIQADGMKIWRERDIALVHSQARAREKLTAQIMAETTAMSNEIVLGRELAKSTIIGLEAKMIGIQTTMLEAKGRIAAIVAMRAERIERGENIPIIDAEITSLQALITTLGEEWLSLEQVVLASRQAGAARMASIAPTRVATMTTLKLAAANYTLRNAFSAVNKTLMIFSMVMMFAGDQQKAMKLMIGSMAFMMVSTLIPSIKMADLATKKWALSTTAATAGINLVVAAIAALVAYGVYRMLPDTIEEDNVQLYEMESRLLSINGLLNDVLAKGDQYLIPEEFWGFDPAADIISGKTFDDLRENADLALDAADVLKAKRDDVKAAFDAATASENDSLAASLESQLTMWDDYYNDVDSIAQAHRDRQSALARKEWSDRRILEEHFFDEMSQQVTYQKGMRQTTSTPEVPEGYWMGGVFYKDIHAVRDFLSQYTDASIDSNKDVIKNFKKLQDDQIFYYDSTLASVRYMEQERVEIVQTANEMILNDMESFANNREELFWGTRENITGALYKTIQQGQIENLLYKTEIMNINNFYGITVDEAVERVMEGIMDSLRKSGIPGL